MPNSRPRNRRGTRIDPERFEFACEVSGKSDVEIARESGGTISRKSLSAYRHGRNSPRRAALEKLANILHVTEAWLLNQSETGGPGHDIPSIAAEATETLEETARRILLLEKQSITQTEMNNLSALLGKIILTGSENEVQTIGRLYNLLMMSRKLEQTVRARVIELLREVTAEGPRPDLIEDIQKLLKNLTGEK